jgi:hypothetical protein
MKMEINNSKGRIGKLPSELREQVALRLRDGVPYVNIADWLAENGHPEINHTNIGHWFRKHYRKWAWDKMCGQVRTNVGTERRG